MLGIRTGLKIDACQMGQPLKYYIRACKYAHFCCQIKIFVITASQHDDAARPFASERVDKEIGLGPYATHDTSGYGRPRILTHETGGGVDWRAKREAGGESMERAEPHTYARRDSPAVEDPVGSEEIVGDGGAGIDDQSITHTELRDDAGNACDAVSAESGGRGVVDRERQFHIHRKERG